MKTLTTYSQEEVATMLGVSLDTLKVWRSARYRGNPLALMPVEPARKGSPSRYSTADLNAWLDRNEAKLREMVGLVALPLARAITHVPHLRGDDNPLPAPVTDWWQVLDADHQPDHQPQLQESQSL